MTPYLKERAFTGRVLDYDTFVGESRNKLLSYAVVAYSAYHMIDAFTCKDPVAKARSRKYTLK